MNSNNPFTVPDSFFPEVLDKALEGRTAVRRRRAATAAIAAFALALVLLLPLGRASLQQESEDSRLASADALWQEDVLAEHYSNDIFLQLNF